MKAWHSFATSERCCPVCRVGGWVGERAARREERHWGALRALSCNEVILRTLKEYEVISYKHSVLYDLIYLLFSRKSILSLFRSPYMNSPERLNYFFGGHYLPLHKHSTITLILVQFR